VGKGDTDYLAPGLSLPPIALPATDGSDISLAALKVRSIVAVYPWTGRPGRPNPPNWDDIPGAHGSTPELEGFRDHYAEFAQRDVQIYGLSRQTTAYQREMAMRLGLPFLILSDAEGASLAELHNRWGDISQATHANRARRQHRERGLSRS
jgi:peroxiredoxin